MNEITNLEIVLPDFPQTQHLHQLVPMLWARSDVEALWLEGSLGRGNADLYSDVDLYVGVTPEAHAAWRTVDIPELFGDTYAAHHFSNFAENFFVYHVYLKSGTIYDLHIQPRNRELHSTDRLLLAVRDATYRDELIAATPADIEAAHNPFSATAVDPDILPSLFIGFWLNADKSRKVLYRRQQLIAYTGFHLFRQMLVRLLFIEQTETDCGDLSRPTIHGLKAAAEVLSAALGKELGQIMGPPTRTYSELWAAQDRLHREVARVGPLLAKRYNVAYPTALAETVMSNWAAFGDVLSELD